MLGENLDHGIEQIESLSASSSEYEDIIEDVIISTNNKYYKIMQTSKTLTDKAKLDENISNISVDKNTKLNKSSHINYLFYFLLSNHNIPEQFIQLEASNPWIIYWLINSSKLMKDLKLDFKNLPMSLEKINTILKSETLKKLIKFQYDDNKGGFGGGYNQIPHLAATYATALALTLTDNLNKIDHSKIVSWFDSLVISTNSNDNNNLLIKTSQPCGETDSRSMYCLLVTAKLLKIDLNTEFLEKLCNIAINLQSELEGGLNGTLKTDESHGGYTYCTLSSIIILLEILTEKKPEKYKGKRLHDFINIDKFIDWLSKRQDFTNGGLNGRNNKLVDGCYSFWIGACGSILDIYGYMNPIDMGRLKEYILFYCQDNERNFPGLRDKPGKNGDFYHTNYVLLGLSLCEYDKQMYLQDGKSLLIKSKTVKDDEEKDVYPVNPIYALPLYILENKI
ncbi:terpenoid cyclases/Protein prenyltransferase [Hanseniaspora valbyensis NRRL Y-1626]|uniref:Terpenoid cyclases/Protein prenyltransferase n=1 Tax=Hanseniaspora valbyensis NRRL Y-1626 TaxID=766949 RepID=A0A1B7TDJ1_9ASCO|nr:terpenoid cyclases/Protein prenyltransferase [Hanseniaspora valbyensis NRRL Y-1626]